MQKLEDYDELMLGTRLKRLSDRMYADVDALYKARGIRFSSGYFAPLILILANKSMAITQLADALGQSHASVSQVSKLLKSEGLISDSKDQDDERRRVLTVTPEGQKLAQELDPLWKKIKRSLAEAIEASGTSFMHSLCAFERQLQKKPLGQRVEEKALTGITLGAVEIIPFDAGYKKDFKTLNIEWLEKFFQVEDIDKKILSQPEKLIIEPGGSIFFARHKQKIIGTAALLHTKPGIYELTKMSVTPEFKGLGIGRKLAEEAIRKFNQLGGSILFLESNSRLKAALHLYESLGFVHQMKTRDSSPYQRADVYMIYQAP